MSREFPDIVDPWKAADGKRIFHGSLPLRWMTRLAALLAAEAGAAESDRTPVVWADAQFEARFAHDRQGFVTIDVSVYADLPLTCQRSLEPYIERVERRSKLAVIENVDDEDTVPPHYDAVLVEEKRLELVRLVEEELLLAVPQVPRKPGSDAVRVSTDKGPEPSAGDGEPTHRPFGGLAEILKKPAGD
jgi:uncharacterized protein